MQFKKLYVIILIALFQTISQIALAETENKYEKIYSVCLSQYKGINNAVVHECSALSSESADMDINFLYQKAYKKISENSIEDAQNLENAQKSWLKYKELHCELAITYIGNAYA